MIEKDQTINVLFAAAEADPFIKAGGLGDVAGALPKAILELNSLNDSVLKTDIRLILPYHNEIKEKYPPAQSILEFQIKNKYGDVPGKCFLLIDGHLKVYLIDGEPIQKAIHLYNNSEEINNNLYTFFSLAIIEIIKKLDWKPDILHANDWHTAISVYKLQQNETDQIDSNVLSVLTIHNLPYFGSNIKKLLHEYKIPLSSNKVLPNWARNIPLPLGIVSADQITTVSPTYAEEIKKEAYGCGLENIFNDPDFNVLGILNGLEEKVWNPVNDPYIETNYSVDNIGNKNKNKNSLLSKCFTEINQSKPLLISVSRLDHQKGIDLIIEAIRLLVSRYDLYFVLLGSGDPKLEVKCRSLEKDNPNSIKFLNTYDAIFSHKMYSAGDIFLMPSRYEPCGISQMIAMKYGCVPIAHATGGLVDTINDPQNCTKPNGFLFSKATGKHLLAVIEKAIDIFINDHNQWLEIQKNGMESNFSWQNSAIQYLNLYQGLISKHKKTLS